MTRKFNRTSLLILLAMVMPALASAQPGGGPTGTSQPSPAVECGIYQWPEVQNPCPEVQIKQKHDHVSLPQYRAMGWDTVITCRDRQITLSCMPYIPVQYTNGYYYVDEIPFNPPDTTFYLGYNATIDANNPYKKKMPISTDDDFASASTNIPYPFYFFGIRKNAFRLGANGLVTFTTDFGSGTTNPWSYSAPLPWTPTTSGAPGSTETFNRMHDAIYGVYEDTYPSPSVHGTTGDPNWGIYYGVLDEYPCRKIICSWNDVPQFSCTDLRCTYQIVCYEGSNIIEVHVKQRQVCSNWNGGNGVIGIQNATGLPQTKSNDPDTPLYWISPGAPAAFFPTGYNTSTSNITRKAFRFTPYGTTEVVDGWYRILPDQNGADSAVQLGNVPGDTNGYCTARASSASACPNLTLAYVSPKCVSRYYYHMRFRNANGDWYHLYDTVTIGIDTLNDLSFNIAQQDVCLGNSVAPALEFRSIQDTDLVNWYVSRVANGQEIPLPTSAIDVGNIVDNGTDKSISITLNSNTLPADGLVANKIDTIRIQSSIDFVSGCQNSASTIVRVFPNFDTTVYAGICRGEVYKWNVDGNEYRETTTPPYPSVRLQSEPGCDSVVRLNLTVYDVSHTLDPIVDCKPITWQNGKTYTQSNTATFDQDTLVLHNRYGCDSIVQLDFTLHPLTARLQASLDYFDYDHLDVELTDLSTGGGERTWIIPNAPDQTTPVAYYTIPVELDSAVIMLVEVSPYGCIDTATITLPFNKESFWVPNIFTPDNPAGNNLFHSVSTQTLRQEMIIYNRMGEMVFRCEGADCAWDGRDLNGNPCVQGSYVYIIRYTNAFFPNKTHIRQGTVTLLR